MSLFLAAVPPEPTRVWLADRAAELRTAVGEHARWVRASKLHATLCFYGTPDPPRRAEVLERVRPAVGRHLDLSGTGLGAFPSLERARVLWVGLKDERQVLHAVAREARLDWVEDRPFVPHCTLARFPRVRRLSGLPRVGSSPTEAWTVRLLESDPSRPGAPYRVVEG